MGEKQQHKVWYSKDWEQKVGWNIFERGGEEIPHLEAAA